MLRAKHRSAIAFGSFFVGIAFIASRAPGQEEPRTQDAPPAAAEELGVSLKTLYNRLNQNSALEKSA